jgi:uncharacterized protein YneF (UPF0154 family)
MTWFDTLLVAFVALYIATIAGVIGIRVLARRMESRLNDVEREFSLDAGQTWQRSYTPPPPVLFRGAPNVRPASLRPFALWLAAAFLAGLLVGTFLTQRLALSALPSSEVPAPVTGMSTGEGVTSPGGERFDGSAVVATASSTAISATEDRGGEVTAPPASEVVGARSKGTPGHRRPDVSDVPREDPAVLGRGLDPSLERGEWTHAFGQGAAAEDRCVAGSVVRYLPPQDVVAGGNRHALPHDSAQRRTLQRDVQAGALVPFGRAIGRCS